MRYNICKMRKDRRAFTLIELIVFVAIFAVSMAAFMSVFTSVVSVQVRQSAAAEVRSQSQFLLQTVQYYVERSSLVDLPTDTATTTLTLRMSSSSEDPVVFDLQDGALQLSIAGDPEQAITSEQVEVSDLSFIKRANPGGKDSVAVSFAVSYVTDNPNRAFSHSLRTAVTRVSAATFDSDIVPAPGTGGDWDLGSSADDWRSVNSTIFFNGDNVGINVTSPQVPLQVSGGDIYIDDSGSGLILRSGSSCFRVTVTGGGALDVATTTCP